MNSSSKRYIDRVQINSETIIYRDARTKSGNFICRVLMKNGKYRSRSTRTDQLPLALPIAQKIFDDLKYRERANLPLQDHSIRFVLEYWLQSTGKNLSSIRRKNLKQFFEFVVPVYIEEVCNSKLGLDFLLKNITQAQLDQFLEWRSGYLREHPTHQTQRPVYPAPNTLKNELGMWNCVMRAAYRSEKIDRPTLIPTLRQSGFKLSTSAKRLSKDTFTTEQIDAIKNHMRSALILRHSFYNKNIVAFEADKKTPIVGEDGATRSKGGMYLSRVNLYSCTFMMLLTGLRLTEAFNLKWEDISKQVVDHDKKNRPREVYVLNVIETKNKRREKQTRRIVVGPRRLEEHFERLKRENPNHCESQDYVLNVRGKRLRSLNHLFEKVQRNVKKVDCVHHQNGGNLDMRHFRSYYATYMLTEKNISPAILSAQTGHSLTTLMQYYFSSIPMQKAMLTLGGWEVSKALALHEFMHSSS